jgi:hypothetical protein
MNTVKRFMYAGIGTAVSIQSALAEIDFGTEKIDSSLQGTDGSTPIVTLQKYIAYATNFLYLIMVGMALYGGWKILTSGAEDEGKEAGKKIIINAVIGLLVIFFASTIASFVIQFLGQSLK